jgi:hypothetical protein
MSKEEELYNLLDEAQLSQILEYSGGIKYIDSNNITNGIKDVFKNIRIKEGLLFYGIDTYSIHGENSIYGVFDVVEFKSYIRKRIRQKKINNIIE